MRTGTVRDYLFEPTLAVKCHCRNRWSFCYKMSSLMLVALKLLLIWLSDSLPGPETCGLLGEVSCPSCCWETCFNCRKQQSPFCAEVSGARHCRWPTFGEPPLWFALLEKAAYCSYWNKKSLYVFKMRTIRKENTKKAKVEISGCFSVLCSNKGRKETWVHPKTWTCLCKSQPKGRERQTWICLLF